MARDLCWWLKSPAEEHGHVRALFDALQRRLYQEKTMRPGLAHLERMVETVQNLVKARLNQAVDNSIRHALAERSQEIAQGIKVTLG
jgi:hypothetical protein